MHLSLSRHHPDKFLTKSLMLPLQVRQTFPTSYSAFHELPLPNPTLLPFTMQTFDFRLLNLLCDKELEFDNLDLEDVAAFSFYLIFTTRPLDWGLTAHQVLITPSFSQTKFLLMRFTSPPTSQLNYSLQASSLPNTTISSLRYSTNQPPYEIPSTPVSL